MSGKRPQSLLEKWLEDVPNSNQVSVKKERKDFKDIFTSSYPLNEPTPLPPPLQSSSASASSSFPQQNHPQQAAASASKPSTTQSSDQDEKSQTNVIDSTSIKGVFGWDSVKETPLPVIMREGEQLVAVRIVESKVIGKFSSCLPWTVFSCINIRSYYVTENEANLLNEINSFHCDYHYGYDPFTTKDVVVCLQDVVTLHKFLDTSKEIFGQGLGKSNIDWLGFVNISGSHVVPYIGKATAACPTLRKYVPQSLVQHSVLLVKVEKVEMNEWDASYLRMLLIYSGLEHLQILANDTLCLLSDLKWDSSLCPLHIEECSPPSIKMSHKVSPKESESYQQPARQPSHQPTHRPSTAVLEDPNWLLASNAGSSNPALRCLHQITRVEVHGLSLKAINLKPYSTQQAVFVSDVVTKLFRGVSILTAHYILEKILQVKLYECTRLQEETYVRAGLRPLQGDKLVLVEVLKKCLPQLRQIILAGLGGFSTLSPFVHHS